MRKSRFVGAFESALGRLASVDDAALGRRVTWRGWGGSEATVQFLVYQLLREEQAALVAAEHASRVSEVERILRLAQQAFGDLRGLLAGREDRLLDREPAVGEWSLRAILRHVLAVELRYAAQILYSAHRREEEPLAIPPERLPCDRLSPPDPQYADTRTAGMSRILERLADARAGTDGLVSGLPEALLVRPSLWGSAEIDVRLRLHQVAAHIVEHVVQCERTLETLGARDGEARRVMRRISAVRGAHETISEDAALRRLDGEYAKLDALIAAPA